MLLLSLLPLLLLWLLPFLFLLLLLPVSANTPHLYESLPCNPAAETALHPLLWCSGR